jgi:hypothetical protein
LGIRRLVFTSDLHIEHHPEVVLLVAERARALGADLLVIAGDVGGRDGALGQALAVLGQAAPKVAFVPGNHDLWTRGDAPDSRQRYLEVLPELCRRAGVHYLPTGLLDAGGVTVLGQTGWYDYSLRHPGNEARIPLAAYRAGAFGKLAWADHYLIRWPGLDDAGLTAWMTERLVRDLRQAPRDRPAVVVTHMLPFDELAAHRRLPWAFVRGFLGARSLGTAIIEAARAGLPIVQVIAGHSHFARRTEVAVGPGRRLATALAPIGNAREHQRMGMTVAEVVERRLRVVEIPVPLRARGAGLTPAGAAV